MIRLSSQGNFEKTRSWLKKLEKNDFYAELNRFGAMGVEALRAATPVDSSLTANSWAYRIIKGKNPGIEWTNSNMAAGTSVAILLQYGHGTGTGGYVQGRDYINPAMKPVFDKIDAEIWKLVR